MISSNLLFTFIIACLVFLVGCSETKDNKLEQKIRILEQRVDNLSHALVTLTLQVSGIDYKSIDYHPSEKGYQRIDSNTGTFLILTKDIQSYVGRYKIILSIGNPSSATYKGFKLK
jgi:hypothetical protein